MRNVKYVDDIFAGKVFKSAQSVPMEHWRWPNFTPAELACKGTGQVMIDTDAMDKLQALRDLLGQPMHLNSAYRSKKHNKAVGGASRSYHLLARAFDTTMENHDPVRFVELARKVGFAGVGYYPPKNGGYNFIHLDTGPKRSWGAPWGVDNSENAAPDPTNETPSSPPEPPRRGRFGQLMFG